MISGSGIFPNELSSRRRSWPLACSIAALLTLGACSSPTAAEPTPPPSTPNTVTVQPPPTPTASRSTPTSIPQYRIGLGSPIFEDTFEIDRGWETGASNRGAVSQLDGKLVVSVQGPSAILSSMAPVNPLADFFTEIEIHSGICEAGDEFGLMVRTVGGGVPTQDSHYRFMITCEGAVRASRFLSGTEAPILPITMSEDVFPGAPAINRLGISAVGSQFRVFVNDIQVFEVEDREIPIGGIGVIVRARHGAQTTISFDEFRVWEIGND